MSSKKINLNAIGPRLVIWSTLLLTVSLLAVSSTVYYLLSSSLRENDQATIRQMALDFGHNIQQKGPDGTKSMIPSNVLVVVLNEKGEEIFSSYPEYLDKDFEDEEEIAQIKHDVGVMPLKVGWYTILLLSGEEDMDLFHKIEYKARKYAWEKEWDSILPIIDNDLVEVYTLKLDNGYWIKVGRSSEDREEQLSEIRYISLIVLAPFIVLGFLLSIVLAWSVLSPVKNLADVIKRIKSGETSARGKIRGTDDEVDTLAKEFNSLLDQNEILITNLKSTIDNVAHDLRTPLTRFRASAEYALSHSDDKEALKEALEDGFENSDTIIKLLNAIMDVSEAETQTMKIRHEKINLHDFITGLVDLFQYSADDKEIKLAASVNLELTVSADRIRLSQALGNLIDNALKYSHEKSTIFIRAEVLSHEIQISVEDQGPGIEKENLDKVWDRLYRGDKSRSTSGLGIGLSVVKAIAKAHQGRVLVVSELNHGSRFSLILPIRNEEVSLS